MTAHLEKCIGYSGRYRKDIIEQRFNEVWYITAGNKKIAVVSKRPINKNITHVQLGEKRKNPLHKQHMDLMMGKVPRNYIEHDTIYRAFKITDSCIDNHVYEIYEIVGMH